MCKSLVKVYNLVMVRDTHFSLWIGAYIYIGEPTKPLYLTAKPTGTSVTLSWEHPTSNGGREDVFYIIKYKTSREEQFTYYSPTPPITGTSATVDSLAPLTTYTFMVVAENGVTQGYADLFPEDDRTSSPIIVVTNTDGEYVGKRQSIKRLHLLFTLCLLYRNKHYTDFNTENDTRTMCRCTNAHVH